jgi:hypothetical protein
MLRAIKHKNGEVHEAGRKMSGMCMALQRRGLSCYKACIQSCVVVSKPMKTTNHNVSPLCPFWSGAAESVRESFPTRDPGFSLHS